MSQAGQGRAAPLRVPSAPAARRPLATLTLAQALYLCAMSVDLTVTSLAGNSLAPSPYLGTVPLALIAVGSVIVAPAVSRMIARLGTRPVFLLGVMASLAGGTLSAVGVTERVFPLLCAGTTLVGGYQAIAGYYRYCAADLGRDGSQRPGRDVSNMARVLAGGVVAAVAGPYLASWAAGWTRVTYAGSYLLVAVLACAALAVVATLRLGPPPRRAAPDGTGSPARPRPLRVIMSQPVFLSGAGGAFAGYFAMAVVMGGAPLAMLMTGPAGSMGGATAQTAFVIQLHIAGMYAPMLVVPAAVRRFGVWPLQAAGTALSLVGVLADISGTTLGQFGAGLLLVGVGWSLLYASCSVLLSRSYTAAERRRVRGYGELAPVSGMMLGSVLAAPLIASLGWQLANVMCAAVLVIPVVMTVTCRPAVTALDRAPERAAR